MIDADKRVAIFELHGRGVGSRQIAQLLGISRNAVRKALRSGQRDVPRLERSEALTEHHDLIREQIASCKGNLVRVHEELEAREVEVGYSTLTGYVRRHGLELGVAPSKQRSGEYHFEPGEEMQHDTSPHQVDIGGKMKSVQCASLVLCYSRMRFVQCYPRFTRFECRIFLTDALVYFSGANARCMVDNSSVILLPGGTGKNAVPTPQMEAFAEHYGFAFEAHAVGDANRSGRVERAFHHIEHNFSPGRTFESFTDLNEQAIAWCDRINAKHRRHLKASPRELFAREQLAMTPLPAHVPVVYDVYRRTVDSDGFVHLHTNRYSAPDELLDRAVSVREYKDRVVIFDGIRPAATHLVLPYGAHGRSRLPEHRRKRGTTSRTRSHPFEDELRAISADFDALVTALKKKHGGRAARQLKLLRQIWLDYPDDPVHAAISRALTYGLLDLKRIENLVLRGVAGDFFQLHPTQEDEGERRPATTPEEPETDEDS